MTRGEREPVITEKSQPVSQDKPSKLPDNADEAREPKSIRRDCPPAIADRSTTPPRSIDPATRLLVDSELKDLPAEERKRWRSYLASIDPALIPHVLQDRTAGIVPPEVASAAESADADSETPVQLLADRNTGNEEPASSLQDLNAPQPEVQQIAAEEEADVAVAHAPIARIGLDDSDPEELSATQSGVLKTAKADLAEDVKTTSENHGFDGIKIWPQVKRGERSLTDRLSGGRLTPPWSRDPLPLTEGKTSIPKAKTATPVDVPVVQGPVDETVRPDPKADYWQDELSKLISLMEAEAARPPVDDSLAERQAHIQRQVYLRMLYLMAAEPEKAQLPISNAEAVDQEFWTSMFWGMSNYFDNEQTGDPGTRAAQTISQLNAAARQLQSIADLELRNVGFCHHIEGWGMYERFERDEFEAGQRVLLYGEVRNFSTESVPSGMYRTLVSSTIEIVRTGQEDTVLERNDLGDTEDQCRGLRTDFYNSYRIDLPTHLAPGSYQLRLTVEDKLSGRFATQTIGFSIR